MNVDAEALTAWMDAASTGNVIFLSKHLAKFKRSRESNGRTALMRAVRGLDAITNTSHTIDSKSAFNISAVTLLARHEAGMVDNEGATALCYAAEANNAPACITLLPTEGSIVPNDGMSALMRAARNRSMEVVPLLIKSHSSSLRDLQGYSALDHACLGGSVEAVEYLINNGYGSTITEINRAISTANSVRASTVADLLAYVRLAKINNMVPCTRCWHSELERKAVDFQMRELERKYDALTLEASEYQKQTSNPRVTIAHNTIETKMLQYRVSYLQKLLSRIINGSVSAGICDIPLSPQAEVYSYTDIGKYSRAVFQSFKNHKSNRQKADLIQAEMQQKIEALQSQNTAYQAELFSFREKIAVPELQHKTADVAVQAIYHQHESAFAENLVHTPRRSSLIMENLAVPPDQLTPQVEVVSQVVASPPRSSTAIQHTPPLESAGLSPRPITSPYNNIEEELSDIAIGQPPLAELRSSAVLFDSGCNTLLMQAALLGDVMAAKGFLDQAGMVNRNGRTALMMAASNGNAEIVSLIIQTGREVKKQDQEGRTALYFAVKGLHYSSIRHLAIHEAGLQKSDGQTSLMVGAKRGGKDLLELLDTEIGMQSTDGWTALMAAADSGNIEACMYLIPRESGLSMKSGWTALMSAAWNGHLEIVNLLREKEAGMQKTNGFTALMAAARNGNLDCLKTLMPYEAELVQTSGKTVLDWCNEYEQRDCAEYVKRFVPSSL